MALTVTAATGGNFVVGDRRAVIATITFDSSYDTGGEALVASDFGLTSIDFVLGAVAKNAAGTLGFTVVYDYTNKKLQAVWGNAGTASVLPEVTSTTDLSLYSVRLIAIGR